MAGRKPSPQRMRRLRIALATGFGILVALDVTVTVLAAHHANRAASSSAATARLAVGTPVDAPLPSLPLIDARGHPTSLAAFRGRYLVLAPSLTLCHEVCPLTTEALAQVRQRLTAEGLGDRVAVAEATVDPWRDTPRRLRAFARRTGTRVPFLTGSQAQVHDLWERLGVGYRRVPQGHPPDVDWLTHRPERFDVEHTDGVFIIDPRGHERIAVIGMPSVAGALPASLSHLLNDQGRANLRRPAAPWTADQVVQDLQHLMGLPADAEAVRPPSAAQARARLTGSPRSLAALHAQGGRVLGGGQDALTARLAALRGHPVVVNEWASWCPPCQREFPLFATAAARFGRRVAFLGLDVRDNSAHARSFLASHPVSYPSYADTGGQAAGSLARFIGLPTTVFIGATGKVTSVHTGQYTDLSTLTHDIESNARAGSG